MHGLVLKLREAPISGRNCPGCAAEPLRLRDFLLRCCRFAPPCCKHPGTNAGSMWEGRTANLLGRRTLAAAEYKGCAACLVVACQARLDPGAARAIRHSRPCIPAALKRRK